MIVNKPYTNKEYADLAVYCNENNCHIEDKGGYLESIENEPYIPTDEEQRQARANAYASEVDPLMAEYNRKKTFNLFEEGEEEALLAEIEAKVEEIKARYPYPVKETNSSDSVLSEDEEVVA